MILIGDYVKKILSILASFGLVSTSAINVISCGNPSNTKSLANMLEKADKRFVAELNFDENIEDVTVIKRVASEYKKMLGEKLSSIINLLNVESNYIGKDTIELKFNKSEQHNLDRDVTIRVELLIQKLDRMVELGKETEKIDFLILDKSVYSSEDISKIFKAKETQLNELFDKYIYYRGNKLFDHLEVLDYDKINYAELIWDSWSLPVYFDFIRNEDVSYSEPLKFKFLRDSSIIEEKMKNAGSIDKAKDIILENIYLKPESLLTFVDISDNKTIKSKEGMWTKAFQYTYDK